MTFFLEWRTLNPDECSSPAPWNHPHFELGLQSQPSNCHNLCFKWSCLISAGVLKYYCHMTPVCVPVSTHTCTHSVINLCKSTTLVLLFVLLLYISASKGLWIAHPGFQIIVALLFTYHCALSHTCMWQHRKKKCLRDIRCSQWGCFVSLHLYFTFRVAVDA